MLQKCKEMERLSLFWEEKMCYKVHRERVSLCRTHFSALSDPIIFKDTGVGVRRPLVGLFL